MIAICFDGKSYDRVLKDGQFVVNKICSDIYRNVFNSFFFIEMLIVFQFCSHHCNTITPRHTARHIKHFIETKKVDFLRQPAYIPDMSFCDSFSMLETFRQLIVFWKGFWNKEACHQISVYPSKRLFSSVINDFCHLVHRKDKIILLKMLKWLWFE